MLLGCHDSANEHDDLVLVDLAAGHGVGRRFQLNSRRNDGLREIQRKIDAFRREMFSVAAESEKLRMRL